MSDEAAVKSPISQELLSGRSNAIAVLPCPGPSKRLVVGGAAAGGGHWLLAIGGRLLWHI